MPRSHSVRIRSLTARGSHRQRQRVGEHAGPHLTDRGEEVMAMVAVNDDLFTRAVTDDPYTYFGRLREEDPVHWNEPYELWVITRHDDLVWLTRHHELFSSEVLKRDPRPPYPQVDASDLELYEYVKGF